MMLSFTQIQQSYPPQLQSFGSFLLREYLQHKILALLFNSDYALKFAFLGGTCLRIVHQTNRFSEDLDLNQQAKDVSPFLFYNQDLQRVLLFKQFVQQTSF